MSRLEELIQELCPNGVEQESIKNICKKICSGGTPKSSVREYYGGNIPWLRTQEVNFCDIFDTDIKITELGYNKSSAKLIPVNCVIVAMYGATAGKVAINKIELTTNQACCNLEIDDTKALYRYVYHFLCSRYEYIKSLGQGSQNNINANIVKELKIPVPPLEIQREIVRILDKFTELTEELTEELINRKRQYEYYRDKLLTVDNNVHTEKLKSIGKVSRGNRVTKSQLSDEGFPVYQNSPTPMGYYSKFNVLGGTTYIITAGAAGEIGFSNEDFWAADDCIVLTELKGVVNRYLYHFLMAKKEYIKSRVRKASIPRLSKEVIENLMVPVPSIEVQNKIINTLDNLDTVCSNLKIDIPTEIEARRKQYEYYRDILLTFAETGNTILTDRQTDRQTIIKLIQYVFGYAPVKLGEIATIFRGGNFQKKDFVENGRPCIHYGQMYTHFGIYADKTLTYLNDEVFAKSKIAKPGDIIMAVTSENVEDVCSCTAWLGNEEIAVSGHTAIISHNQNAKYLSYYFHSAMFYKQKKKLAHGTKVIEVTPSKLADIEIMLPTLEEQERIVSILDRFDSLCNDLTSGLPAEIEARQKQYEYYRDKLLSFK